MTSKKLPLLSIEIWATLLVALSGILYGFMGFLGTKIFTVAHCSVPNMLFWRFLVASIWIISYSLYKKENLFNNLPKTKTLIGVFLLGSIFYSGGSAFYFLAANETGTGPAMVIFFSYPMFVAIFSWFMNNWKMNIFAMGALLAIMIGLIMLRGQGETALSIVGITFAMIAALSYASYIFNSKQNVSSIHSSLSTILICVGNTVLFFIVALVTHSLTLPDSLHAWIYITLLGIFVTAIPIQLMLHGLKIISSLKASILSVLEPAVTLIVGVILLNESMSSLQIVGVAIILLGAVLIQFEKE